MQYPVQDEVGEDKRALADYAATRAPAIGATANSVMVEASNRQTGSQWSALSICQLGICTNIVNFKSRRSTRLNVTCSYRRKPAVG
jgi:hypothetical protein